jgi:F0F1-type ATP synthase membrane subunit b/b'
MSVREIIGRLTEAKSKLTSAQQAAANAATQIGQAEESVKRVLDGAQANALVTQIEIHKQKILDGMKGIEPLKAEIDKAITRAQAIGSGR